MFEYKNSAITSIIISYHKQNKKKGNAPMCKSILNTLRIKDKNLNFSDEVIEKKHKGRMSLFYYAELTYQPTHCENCSTKMKISL